MPVPYLCCKTRKRVVAWPVHHVCRPGRVPPTPITPAQRLLSAIRRRHADYPPEVVRPLAEIEARVQRMEHEGTVPELGCEEKLQRIVTGFLVAFPGSGSP